MRTAINDANSVLIHSLGHLPTVAEIAAYLKVSEEAVLEGLEGALAYSTASLSAPANTEGTREIGDTLGSDEYGYELTEAQLALGPALRRLNDRDRRILTLRFYGNQTQTEIAPSRSASPRCTSLPDHHPGIGHAARGSRPRRPLRSARRGLY
jgi:RNA polymerase sigma-B factor